MDGGMWDRLRRLDPRIWDGLLMLAVTMGGLIMLQVPSKLPAREPDLLAEGLVIAASVPIYWRRRAPLVVMTAAASPLMVFAARGYEQTPLLPIMIAVYTAAATTERTPLLRVLLPLAAATIVVSTVFDPSVDTEGYNWAEISTSVLVAAGVPFAVGRMTFNRRRRIENDRQLAAREAVVAERARIARELHDVVAHHMSVMVVQAGAARAVGTKDPAAAHEALRQIEASGRTGLAEMRRLLELLKAGDGDVGTAPQPGLAHLEELLDGMRAAGLPVETVIEGSARPLPPGVDLSAFRIVQEALTNTLRHAGAASARVLLRYEPEELEIEVADDGVGPSPDGVAAGGHGLIGMRERVQIFGGALEAGPRPGGGFLVKATLPTDVEP